MKVLLTVQGPLDEDKKYSQILEIPDLALPLCDQIVVEVDGSDVKVDLLQDRHIWDASYLYLDTNDKEQKGLMVVPAKINQKYTAQPEDLDEAFMRDDNWGVYDK